jgi:hypothetical protein
MTLKRYDFSDFDHVFELFHSRGKLICKSQLPSIGFVTENAACFLITTNSNACFIEWLVARNVPTKDEEMDAVVNACIQVGAALGFKNCYALTDVTAVVERAFKHSFKIEKQKVLLSRGL